MKSSCNPHISKMLSRSQMSAVAHDPDDDYLDADHQILSPPAREISGPSLEVLPSSFHLSQTSSAARHPRRQRLSCQESRANSLVQTPYFEAAYLLLVDSNHLYTWPLVEVQLVRASNNAYGVIITTFDVFVSHCGIFLSGRYAALVKFYFCPQLHCCF